MSNALRSSAEPAQDAPAAVSPLDVSVVVPVYNTGRYLEPLVDGLMAQTLPRDRFEVIFIDDGSTDETPARLDALAAEHSWITVVHQANSGWPGQPRNRGIGMARGEYIFFSDHDDRLGPEALDRMVTRARQTGADILIPKAVSLGRPVPRRVFRTNIDHAVLGVDAILSTTSPHKLFRRGFLNHHELRFPEGKVRLEDIVFVMAAYLKAEVVTVLSDYPCYYRYARDDGNNSALQPWTADYYYGFVEEIIDLIEDGTEPGELRDALLMRPYDTKMLSKLTGKWMFRWSPDHRQAIFNEVRRLAMERFPEDFHETQLTFVKAAHARALIADRLDRMEAVAKMASDVKVRAALARLAWEDDHWVATVEGELIFKDGTPVTVQQVDGGWQLDTRLIPSDLAGPPVPTESIRFGLMDITLTHYRDKVEWYAPSTISGELVPIAGSTTGDHRAVFTSTVIINPVNMAGGVPLLPGRWDVRVRVAAWGLQGMKSLSRAGRWKAMVAKSPAYFDAADLKVAPQFTRPGPEEARRVLSFRVETAPRLPVRLLLRRVRELTVTPAGRLTAAIDVRLAIQGGATTVEVVLLNAQNTVIGSCVGELRTTSAGCELTADLATAGKLRPGRVRVAIKTGRRARMLGVITVASGGKIDGFEPRKPKPIALPPPTKTAAPRKRRSVKRRIGSKLKTELRIFAS